jgi:hypothetical protein
LSKWHRVTGGQQQQELTASKNPSQHCYRKLSKDTETQQF